MAAVSFLIEPNTLEAVALAAYKDAGREHLKGVHLSRDPSDDKAVQYQATNGHFILQAWRRGAVDDQPVQELDAILPIDLVKEIVSCKKGRKPLIATVGEGNIHVTCGDEAVAGARLIDRPFPDIERVKPKLRLNRKIPVEVGFNLEYVGTIAKAIKLHTGSKFPHAAMMLNDDVEGASMFRARDFLAILMPVRLSSL